MIPEDFHAWLPTAHHKIPELAEYIDEFLSLDLSTKTYYPRRYPRLLYIWGHSYEFDRDDNWDLIEKYCEKLSAKSDEIWFATNIDIYEYVTAYKSLIYSADGHRVYNPSLLTMWIDVDGETYTIKPGETIKI